MAELDSQLKTVLDAHAGLTALVSTRIYNDQAPQGVSYPCIIYTVYIEQVHTIANDSDEALVQVDILGNTKTECVNVRTQVRAAFESDTSITALFDSHQSRTPDDGMDIKREIISFRVWYNR